MHNSQQLTSWIISLSLCFLIRAIKNLIWTSHFIKAIYIAESLCLLYQQLQKSNPIDFKVLKFSNTPIQGYINWILYTCNTIQRKLVLKGIFRFLLTAGFIMQFFVNLGKKTPDKCKQERGMKPLDDILLCGSQWGSWNLKHSWKDIR